MTTSKFARLVATVLLLSAGYGQAADVTSLGEHGTDGRGMIGSWLSDAAHKLGSKLLGIAAKSDGPVDESAKMGPQLRGMIAQDTFTPKRVDDTMMPKPDGESESEMGMKLRALVAQGKITPVQARAKLEAWKKLEEAKVTPEAMDWDETSTKRAMGWKLHKMVAKGLFTAEQAREKLAAWVAKAAGKEAALEDGTPNEDMAALRKKLRVMVAKGEITPEEAREKMSAWRVKAFFAAKLEDGTSLETKHALMKLREMVVKDEIPKREAVQKLRILIGQGMITREEARAKIAAWQASASAPAAIGEDESKADALLASKLAKMVAKGEMTSEQAHLKLAIRKKVMNGEITREQAMAAWEAKAAPALAAKAEDTTADSTEALDAKLDKLIEKGDMTPEQARMKLMLHKMIAKGSITMAQARAKMAALQAKAADTIVV